MALLPDVFVPDEAEDNPFAPIPAGWYIGEIIKSELKDTRDGTGKYLALTFKIADGDHANRLIFTNLNIVNKSDVAVKIARSDLKAICEAVGLEGDLEDTVDLHGTPMNIKVSVKPETAQWPAKNELKAFKPESWSADDDDDAPF
jgi:hypothetical protein